MRGGFAAPVVTGRRVFPGGSGYTITKTDLLRLRQQHGIAQVPHGFRSSFRDWAAYLHEESEQVRSVTQVTDAS